MTTYKALCCQLSLHMLSDPRGRSRTPRDPPCVAGNNGCPCTLMLPGETNMSKLSLFNILILCSSRLLCIGLDYFSMWHLNIYLGTELLEPSANFSDGKNASLASPSPGPNLGYVPPGACDFRPRSLSLLTCPVAMNLPQALK